MKIEVTGNTLQPIYTISSGDIFLDKDGDAYVKLASSKCIGVSLRTGLECEFGSYADVFKVKKVTIEV